MASSPLDGEPQEVLIGGLLGVAAALGAQYFLLWRNLRWSWALLPVATGLLLVAGLHVIKAWSVGLAVAGLLTAGVNWS